MPEAALRILDFLFRRHPVLAALLAVALVGLLWFGGRFVSQVIYFSDPAHRNEALAPWMSPGYVGRSWGLPPEVIRDVMNLSPAQRGRTVAEVAARLGVTLPELEQRIRDAKAAHRDRGVP